jgi:hypothetical protein
LFKEFENQKKIYKASKASNGQLFVPEPYSFLSTTNPIDGNDESYIFMQYID